MDPRGPGLECSSGLARQLPAVGGRWGVCFGRLRGGGAVCVDLRKFRGENDSPQTDASPGPAHGRGCGRDRGRGHCLVGHATLQPAAVRGPRRTAPTPLPRGGGRGPPPPQSPASRSQAAGGPAAFGGVGAERSSSAGHVGGGRGRLRLCQHFQLGLSFRAVCCTGCGPSPRSRSREAWLRHACRLPRGPWCRQRVAEAVCVCG